MVGFDPGRSRSIQRSFTVHGDAALAARARRDLVAEYSSTRSASGTAIGGHHRGAVARLSDQRPADMIRRHAEVWAARTEPEQDWLFNSSPRRLTYLTADALSHKSCIVLLPSTGPPGVDPRVHGVAQQPGHVNGP